MFCAVFFCGFCTECSYSRDTISFILLRRRLSLPLFQHQLHQLLTPSRLDIDYIDYIDTTTMAALLRCLLRTCFGDPEEGPERHDGQHDSTAAAPVVAPVSASSSLSRGSLVAYQSAPRTDPDEREADEDDTGDVCCQGRNSPNDSNASGSQYSGLQEFWSKLRERLATFETAASSSDDGQETSIPANPNYSIFRRSKSKPIPKSSHDVSKQPFLKTASTFDASFDVPTISPEEIVMPGSKLQAQMALAAAKSLEEMGDECVICMEGFDPTNPRMPTLCGCGQNKTYFHLPCLYQWIEQNNNCPSCRKRLRWEEF
jgi:hypothetical protein